ncbi:MAG: Mut7-C RNAse domain-containing protein [Nitrospirota bacterium]|jgi:uncharacterized protein with PIN domain
MKFIADAMLGRLAKWMRIIGCDVAYYRKIEDAELVELAAKDNRLILTKDNLLIKRRKAKGNYFLVESNSYKEQLKQMVTRFSIDPYQSLLTRCIECNILLTEIAKDEGRESVPEYVYNSQTSFMRCPECEKIYWPATHKSKIIKTLKDIFKED